MRSSASPLFFATIALASCGADYSILGIGGSSDDNKGPPVAADAGNTQMIVPIMESDDAGIDPRDATPPIDTGPPQMPYCHVEDPFSAPTLVKELNSATLDSAPKVSADELVVVFSSTRAMVNGNSDWAPFIATRAKTSDPWGTPAMLSELDDSTAVDTDPLMSDDGLTIWFASNRNNATGLHPYMATRANVVGVFTKPTLVTALDAAGKNTDGFAFSPDGKTLFFASDRGTSQDIWSTTLGGASLGVPALVTGLDSAASEYSSAMTGDALTIYFSSSRTPTLGDTDIWVATRATPTSAWGNLRSLPELASASSDQVGSVSRDGCRIWIARCTGTGLACLGSFDIYMASKSPR